MHALDAFYDEASIRFVTTRHEQGTTYLADGYARASGRPGVAFVVPGVGHLQRRRRPGHRVRVLLPRRAHRRPGEPGRHRQAPRPAARDRRPARPRAPGHRSGSAGPWTPTEIADTVHEAFVHVQRGRRQPVEIEMPPEAFSESADIALVRAGRERAPRRRSRRDRARRRPPRRRRAPVIWSGGGVVLGDATAELAELAEFLQAAVVTTRQGKGGFDARNPLYAGTAWVNKRLQPLLDDADVVLAVGTHLIGNALAGRHAGRPRRRRPRRDRHPPPRRAPRRRRRRAPRSPRCSPSSAPAAIPPPIAARRSARSGPRSTRRCAPSGRRR